MPFVALGQASFPDSFVLGGDETALDHHSQDLVPPSLGPAHFLLPSLAALVYTAWSSSLGHATWAHTFNYRAHSHTHTW